jgi:sigma-54 dependent transcriptional regulator of gfr operon
MPLDVKASILSEIERLCAVNNLETVIITTDVFTHSLNIKRNTASHYLNELVKDKLVVKVNTRPVRFYLRKRLEEVFKVALKKCDYDSVADLFSLRSPTQDPLDQVIGAHQSLFSQMKRLKAAARYPGVGLPVLLTGPTGSGKSYLANMYYKYCVSRHFLDTDSKFVHLNCAEYADNPELLASILFGYKRGAFTGADRDSSGLFDSANNGMLFLDEVHRLGSKGQEKLFEYLDNGVISPLGETKAGHKVEVRLIFATTENIQSNFLQTFIRRIPVQVEIPGINERTQFERESLTKLFFLNQAQHVARSIGVSKQVLGVLTGQHYDSNVGQMKNDVTLAVANALANAENTEGMLSVMVSDLPAEIWQRAGNSEGLRLRLSGDINVITVSPDMSIQQLVNDETDQDNQIRQTFTQIIKLYDRYGLSTQFLESGTDLINTLSDEMIFSEVINRGEVPLDLLKRLLQVKINALEDSYSVEFSGNSLIVLAYFFYYRQFNYWMVTTKSHDVLTEISTALTNKYPRTAEFAEEIMRMVHSSLALQGDVVDSLFLQLYLQEAIKVTKDNLIRCLVLAHGYSTASSIANVVNRLTNTSVMGYIDMPLDINVESIGRRVSDYITSHSISSGLILLVDMGSLAGVHQFIHGTINFPIGIITNVSTQSALAVANQVSRNIPIDEIVAKTADSIHSEGRVIYSEKVKKNLIVTCCNTGIGTANQIKRLLDSSFADKMDIVVNAYEYKLIESPEQIELLKKTYNVLAIVGTVDPHVDTVPFIPLEKLILGEDSELLLRALGVIGNKQKIEEVVTTILHNFTIERVINSLTILDASAVMDTIDVVMSRFIQLSGQSLSNPKRMALYVHVSCMIERLIRNEPITTYDWNSRSFDTKLVTSLKEALSVLEAKYSVTVPKSELGYIDDIIEGK